MIGRYTVTVYVNVKEDMSFFLNGLQPRDPIAEVDTFEFALDTTTSAELAANRMWAVGNKEGLDHMGKAYPIDVRSLSVGDLLKVVDDDGKQTFLAVESIGHREVPEPTNPIVPLNGTRATSRK